LVVIGPYHIELVPEGNWDKTLAQLARRRASFRPTWEQIRRRELERASFRCEICRADGLLECNEMWSFDETNHVQTLVGYKAVCPACLSILQIGRTIQLGGLERTVSHFIRVTGFAEDDLKEASNEALKTWRRRSAQTWRVNFDAEPLAKGLGDKTGSESRQSPSSTPSRRPRVEIERRQNKPTGKQTSLSPTEVAFLKTQRLARIATASPRGVPEVSPVSFEFDGRFFWIGSHNQSIFFRTQRYRNITGGNNRVSLVIDDLQSVDPWRPRGLKVSGTAQVMDHNGIFGKGRYFRITPRVSVSWGIEKPKEGQWTSKKIFEK
jgi:pyridoxamine 5'-phosphate oxidase family protein